MAGMVSRVSGGGQRGQQLIEGRVERGLVQQVLGQRKVEIAQLLGPVDGRHDAVAHRHHHRKLGARGDGEHDIAATLNLAPCQQGDIRKGVGGSECVAFDGDLLLFEAGEALGLLGIDAVDLGGILGEIQRHLRPIIDVVAFQWPALVGAVVMRQCQIGRKRDGGLATGQRHAQIQRTTLGDDTGKAFCRIAKSRQGCLTFGL